MNLFVLLGSFLFIGIPGVLLLCLVVLIITACVKRSWRLALWSIGGTAGAMIAVTGVFCGLAYLWFRPYDPTTKADLQNAYKADFGTLPPAGVTVLKSRQIVIADSGGQWLLLKATPEEIDRHIGMGFQKAEAAPRDFRDEAGANAPKWWQPPTARLELYENTNWSKAGGWHSSQATMGVDRASNLIWFAASKWD
jgi:hypothetical protein